VLKLLRYYTKKVGNHGKYIEELDSLRGLAAISVLFSHLLLILPIIEKNTYGDKSYWLINLLKYTPFHIFGAGIEPVLLFFILSGFVLSLSFYYERKPKYFPFLIKRILRLYIPYIVAVFFAIIMKWSFYKGKIEGISDWANTRWDSPITFSSILDHVFFITSFKNYVLNPVLWSLVYEMRVSIIFPLLMVFIIRWNWKMSLSVSIGLSLVGYVIHLIFNKTEYFGDHFDTVMYIFVFVMGALLAKHHHFFVNMIMALPTSKKFIIVVLAFSFYSFRFRFFPNHSELHVYLIDYFIVSFGASMFLIFAMTLKRFSLLLKKRPIHILGKISYSLYLYHGIVLLVLVNMVYGIIPIWLIWCITIVVSVLISYASYIFVEQPSIKMARKAASISFFKKKSINV
jgi:peptidoglycan/LPS O-acetylase OafA/YrhL